MNGTNACLEVEADQVDLPDGPFTVESWIKPSNDTNGAIVANLRIGGFSLEVAGVPRFRSTSLIWKITGGPTYSAVKMECSVKMIP